MMRGLTIVTVLLMSAPALGDSLSQLGDPIEGRRMRASSAAPKNSNRDYASLAPGETRTGRFLGTRPVDPERLVEEGTLDRIATVDEVARVVEFFAGPLGAFVSGQVLRVDGGIQCWPA